MGPRLPTGGPQKVPARRWRDGPQGEDTAFEARGRVNAEPRSERMTSTMRRRRSSHQFLGYLAMAFAAPLLAAAPAQAKVLVEADGPGGTDTYTILGRNFTIETPDCGHHVPHITEAYDDILKKNVFVFHLHVKVFLDDDRCGGKDRQRTEIRGKGEASANEGETVYYRWKFKLPAGFQSSPNFCHIMQIKSNDGNPVMTLTPRNNTDIEMAGRLGINGKTALAPFIDTWMVATMKILHANNGTWELTIRRISDGAMTFHYAGTGDTWDANTPQDPKWGIYRSLNTLSALRDEDDVRFADFCISKVSAAECDDHTVPTSDASVSGPTPSADAGAGGDDAIDPQEPDAGEMGAADTGDMPMPPVTSPDASAGPTPTTKSDARPSNTGTPSGGGDPTPPTTDPETPPTMRAASKGCYVGAGAGTATGGTLGGLFLLGALAMRLRRRR
jgi:hypothetical protein